MTPTEMNEQVSLRLGWSFQSGEWGSRSLDPQGTVFATSPYCDTPRAELLPDWSTDDGLAFKELWPKIVVGNDRAPLGLSLGRIPPIIPLIYDKEFQPVCKAGTWAEAICLAFLSLTEVEDEKINS